MALYNNVVTKFILPSIGDLNFSKLRYDNTCAYLDNKHVQDTETKKQMPDLKMFCKKIEPFVIYYTRIIKLYNNTGHIILRNEIDTTLSTKETKMWNNFHISVQLHRTSL